MSKLGRQTVQWLGIAPLSLGTAIGHRLLDIESIVLSVATIEEPWIGFGVLTLGMIALWRWQTQRLLKQWQQAQGDLQGANAKLQDLLLALDAARMSVWEADVQTGEQTWSPQTEAIWGFEPGTFDGTVASFLNRIHPDDRAYTPQINQMALKVGEYQAEFRIVLPDGTIRWLSNHTKVFYDKLGEPIRMIGIDLDVTERKQVETALRQSGEHYRQLADDMPALICCFLPDSTLTYVNPAYCQYFKQSAETLIGHQFLDLLPNESARQAAQAHYLALTPATPSAIYEHPVVRPDGSAGWQQWVDRAFFDEEGHIISFQSVGFDISDQKRIEVELRQQKELLQTIFDHLPVMVGLYSDRGDVLLINRELERVIGWKKEDYQTVDILRDCYPDPEIYEQVLTHIITADSTWKDFKTQVRDGRILDTSWTQIHLSDGRSIGIGQDITERKRIELALKQLNDELELQVEQRTAALQISEARFRRFFEFAPIGIAVTDINTYRFVAVNQSFCSLLDYSESELLGLASCMSISVIDDWDIERPHTEALIRGEVNVYQIEKRYIKKSGEIIIGSLTTTALRNVDGEIVYLLGMVSDITERKLAEQKIQQTVSKLIEINQELEFFSYSVSHDLRAPLRHIHGFVNALKQKLASHDVLTDPKVVHYLDVIESSSQKMALLIDGLLTLSRIGRKPIASRSVELRALVDEAIVLVQSTSATASCVEFVIGQLPTIQGDATLLQQVLSNLISNAVKFSRNTPVPRIEIGTTAEGAIFVRDNGVGFDMKYADKLFGAFQRLHNQADFEGIDIGLAIVQRIIHRHGGTIWAESYPNQGATFYFTLTS